jgi:hypothetical protein
MGPWSYRRIWEQPARFTIESLHLLDVPQREARVEDGLLRAIQTEPRKPFLPGLGVKPVGLLTGGRLRI